MTKYGDTVFLVSAMSGAALFVLLAAGRTDLKLVLAQLDDLKAQIGQFSPKVTRADNEVRTAAEAAPSAATAATAAQQAQTTADKANATARSKHEAPEARSRRGLIACSGSRCRSRTSNPSDLWGRLDAAS
jgi:uncharacterized protein (DUF3084 family)